MSKLDETMQELRDMAEMKDFGIPENHQDRLLRIMSDAMFVPVVKDELQHNHAERLWFWLETDRFMLFRNRVSVDNYVALDIQRGFNQFLPFSMARESGSDNYVENYKGAYYLTLEQTKALVEAMEIIRQKVSEL